MEIVKSISRDDYERHLANFPERNFLQSWQWGETHEKLGHLVFRWGVSRGAELAAVWTGVVKDARRGRYLEVAGGPHLDWQDKELAKLTLLSLKEAAREARCIFVRLRPQLEETKKQLGLLRDLGLKKSPMHLQAQHTNILDITSSEDEILKNMRRQTRYEVRRVAKKGVRVTSRTPAEEDITRFYDLQSATARKQRFIQSPLEFLVSLATSFGDDLKIFEATKDGRLLNQALVIHYGEEADYFEAASTEAARSLPGAYGVVWSVIKQAKSLGYRRLNLWGISHSRDSGHRYAGVTTFKRGFGGQDVAYVPAHDLIVRPLRYLPTWVFETIRRKKRKL